MSNNKPGSDVFTDIEQSSVKTFAIEDDDECVIDDDDDDDEPQLTPARRNAIDAMLGDSEDTPDDFDRGDQLPSVEEVKASNAYLPTAMLLAKSHRRKIYLAIGAAAILAVMISISISIGVYKRSNKMDDAAYQHDFEASKEAQIDKVFKFLETHSPSKLPDFRDPRHPQHRAAEFLAVGEKSFIDFETTNPVQITRLIERFILVTLYYASGGDLWTDRFNFLNGDHCEWNTVVVTPMGRFIRGVQCDDYGFVADLDLSNNNLVANNLPNELEFLSKLRKLHLFGNTIGGSIPGLTRLTNLVSLGLMDLDLRGTIPTFLGKMTKLTTLGLGQNKFHGSIPSEIEKLSDLRILGLDGMGLTGNISPVLKLQKLQALYLEDNNLEGEIYQNEWTDMRELDVSNNMIDGRVPDNLFESQHLHVIDIHRNLFFGDMPKIVTNPSVEYIAMQSNSLSGTISDRIGFLQNLKHLDIAGNNFSGTLPDTIQLLTNMVSLSTSGNKFSPTTLKEDMFKPLEKLQDLSMKGNNLTGTLPEFFALSTNLRMLDLDGNSLMGTISTWYGILSELAVLQLNRNKLSGTIPSELKNVDRLQILLLDGNNFTGNTKQICESNKKFFHFTTDCYPGKNGMAPEVDCRCCTLCCNDENPDCNNKDWTASYDPKAKYGYIRPAYEFSLDEAPEGWQKAAAEGAVGESGTLPPGFGNRRV